MPACRCVRSGRMQPSQERSQRRRVPLPDWFPLRLLRPLGPAAHSLARLAAGPWPGAACRRLVLRDRCDGAGRRVGGGHYWGQVYREAAADHSLGRRSRPMMCGRPAPSALASPRRGASRSCCTGTVMAGRRSRSRAPALSRWPGSRQTALAGSGLPVAQRLARSPVPALARGPVDRCLRHAAGAAQRRIRRGNRAGSRHSAGMERR